MPRPRPPDPAAIPITTTTDSEELASVIKDFNVDAELDLEKTRILCDFIEHSNHQVFITTVDPSKLTSVLNDAAMFHVKHQ